MSVAFDTLRAARKLRDEGGFDERQAAILVDTFAEGMTETLATKADLESTEGSLRAEIEKSEAALRNDLEKSEAALRGEFKTLRGEMRELEQRMTIRLGAMMMGAVALIVALIKLV